jgi:hypothetical protein
MQALRVKPWTTPVGPPVSVLGAWGLVRSLLVLLLLGLGGCIM